jgi:hypothetical protein
MKQKQEEMSTMKILFITVSGMGLVLLMGYLFSHQTNFQEVVPPLTDKGGSTLFIERCR